MGATEDLSRQINSALVTGGGGFVGKAIVKLLVGAGVKTRVIARNNYPDLTELGVECIVGSICDLTRVSQAAQGVDVVFHVAALAGIWGPWKDYYNVNVVGTENIIEACRCNNVSALVYTSTPSVVFNRQDIKGADETLGYADDFLCHYAKSKVTAEKIVLSAAGDILKTCAIRPHLIWGPGDPHLVPRLLERGRQKMLKQVGRGDNFVDISYIDNVAHSHILAAINLTDTASSNGKAYFISQSEPVNLWGWINDLFGKFDIDPVEQRVSYRMAYFVGGLLERIYGVLRLKKEPRMTRFLAEQLAKSHYFSIAQAQKDLGYSEVVSTEEGLRRTVEWFKKQ